MVFKSVSPCSQKQIPRVARVLIHAGLSTQAIKYVLIPILKIMGKYDGSYPDKYILNSAGIVLVVA